MTKLLLDAGKLYFEYNTYDGSCASLDIDFSRLAQTAGWEEAQQLSLKLVKAAQGRLTHSKQGTFDMHIDRTGAFEGDPEDLKDPDYEINADESRVILSIDKKKDRPFNDKELGKLEKELEAICVDIAKEHKLRIKPSNKQQRAEWVRDILERYEGETLTPNVIDQIMKDLRLPPPRNR